MARSGGFFGSFSANKPSDEEVRRQSGQNSSSAENVIDVMFKIIFSFTLTVILLSIIRRIFVNHDILTGFLTSIKLDGTKLEIFEMKNIYLMVTWAVDLIFLITLIALSGKQSKLMLIILSVISVGLGVVSVCLKLISAGDMIDNVATAALMIALGVIIFVEIFFGEH